MASLSGKRIITWDKVKGFSFICKCGIVSLRLSVRPSEDQSVMSFQKTIDTANSEIQNIAVLGERPPVVASYGGVMCI